MNGRTNSSDVTIQEINYGALIPLEAPTDLMLNASDKKVELTWKDPIDKYADPGGELVSQWDHDVIVRKIGSVPTSPDDGVQVGISTTRDQYAVTSFVDTNNLVNDTTYYYAIYAYSTLSVPSDALTGSAKPIAGIPTYYGEVPSLGGNQQDYVCSISFHQKALFGGGHKYANSNFNPDDTVISYDTSLTKQTVGTLSEAKARVSGDRISNTHCIFAGGMWNRGDYGYNCYDTVDAFDTSFTRSTLDPLTQEVCSCGAAPVGERTMLVGGTYYSVDYDEHATNRAYCFDSSLTRSTATALSVARDTLSAGSIGNYAVFAGGRTWRFVSHSTQSSPSNYVDAYDTSLTKSSPEILSEVDVLYNKGVTIGDHLIFIIAPTNPANGGTGSSFTTLPVDAYDVSLTKSTITPVTLPTTYDPESASSYPVRLGSFAFVPVYVTAGAVWWETTYVKYDSSLTQTVVAGDSFPPVNSYMAYDIGAVAEKYAFFPTNLATYVFEAV